MNKKIKISEISGSITAPPSKSMMQRVVAVSMLTKGKTLIKNPSYCDDSKAALNLVSELGVNSVRFDDRIELKNEIDLNSKIISTKRLSCRESGLCIRMFAPVLSLFDSEFSINASGTLSSRVIDFIGPPLSKLGVSCKTNKRFPPLNIKGPLRGGNIDIDGNITTQFLTGLLLALPLCKKDSNISVKNLKSKPYIEMTLNLLERTGIKIEYSELLDKYFIKGDQSYIPMEHQIEGDWSSASFLLSLGALKGKINVKGLDINSKQADKKILKFLKLIGADIRINGSKISVERKSLKPFTFDIGDSPDLFPPIAALGAYCNGKSTITGIERLKYKESNRGVVIKKEFKKLGINIELYKDRAVIFGKSKHKNIGEKSVSAHSDHRIAMALAMLGVNSKEGVVIEGWESVSKSYPDFFLDLEKLGGRIS